MSEFLRSFLLVAIFGLLALVVAGGALGLSSLIRPQRASAQKYIPYESGVNPFGDGWSQSHIRYYLFALLFVMFDVEAVFIFPWATRVEVYGWFGVISMGLFMFLVLDGLLYAWKKGVLRWV